MSTYINLVSSNGKGFPVEMNIASKSVTIKTMLEDLGLDDNYNGEPYVQLEAVAVIEKSTGFL